MNILLLTIYSILISIVSSTILIKPSLSVSSNSKMTEKKKKLSPPGWPTTDNEHILVTGGSGFIGTHTIICLLNSGYDVTVVDNLCNSNIESLRRVFDIAGISRETNRVRFYNVDLCNYNDLHDVFQSSPEFSACIHFAGLKAVGESVREPLRYYSNNLDSTFNLLNLMDKFKCRTIVFSSSATVYGSATVPITEDTPAGVGITNAYGRTKFMIEEILKDFKKAKEIEENSSDSSSKRWSIITLRYFNPVGNHPSGKIGEDPNGIPNNLMPYVSQVAVGRREKLTIFGSDYDTPDGTGVRDYIHVMDLAEGHVASLQYIRKTSNQKSANDGELLGEGYGKYNVFNLGSLFF